MALINKRSTIVLDLVDIWCPRPSTHENDALSISKTKIHSPLETDSNRRAHFRVRKDITGLEHA